MGEAAEGARPRPRRSRRSRRDWVVDISAFLVAAAFGAVMAIVRIDEQATPSWVLAADQLAGALSCAALWLRRRWPVELALAVIPLTAFSETAGGASAVALFTVAVHRPPRLAIPVTLFAAATAPIYAALRPEADLPYWFVVVFGIAVTFAVLGWGLFVRHRRQLIASLRERAERAEAEGRLRAEHAQTMAREQIAREMHDVLGHRLSLLSVQAGALEYRRDASPSEIANAASVIRSSAHQALQDLREVIGVLRAPDGELLPQPTLADLDELITESRRAGMRVGLRSELDPRRPVPDSLGRTTYRIVQEALTNARKHAPGAEVCAVLAGGPERGLTVEVGNTVPGDVRAPTAPGLGLIGLAERAALAGGYLAYQRTGGDDRDNADHWRLWAWLPWPA